MKKGDTVKIITGKDAGKSGKVLRIDKKTHRVAVEGVNMYKKHARGKRQGEKGEVVTITRPLDISNVLVVCSSCNKAVREAHKINEGKKVRYCRKCGATL